MPDKYFFGVAKPGRTEFGIHSFESSNMVDGLVAIAELINNTPFHDGFVFALASNEDIVRKRLAKHQRANRSDLAAQLSVKLAMLASPSEASEGKDLPNPSSKPLDDSENTLSIDEILNAAINKESN